MFKKIFDIIQNIIFYVSIPFVFIYLIIYMLIFYYLNKSNDNKKKRKVDICISKTKYMYNKLKNYYNSLFNI